jgi:A/G-specific adenine glycosylase
MQRKQHIHLFVDAIWNWYAEHRRTLPWRDMDISDEDERAYRVLVSEVMLQQTQVDRVKVLFVNFLERFPRLEDLARASNKDVILAWQGMGYNNRALRLRDCAKTILERTVMDNGKLIMDNGAVFPREMDELIKLPGIGYYTAAAIRNFAFNLPTPCIDTNIRRVLHRTFFGPENSDGTWKKSDGELLKLAGEVLGEAMQQAQCHPKRSRRMARCYQDKLRRRMTRLPWFDSAHHDKHSSCDFHRSAAEWHAALMDFGSLVQTKTNPKWDECPLTQKGLMKAIKKNFPKSIKKKLASEPGRKIAGKFVPNRIIRGRIIQALRGADAGLSVVQIGAQVCEDWDAKLHKIWLENLLTALEKDGLIMKKRGRVMLGE